MLVHLDRVHLPVRLLEGAGVPSHVVNAGVCEAGARVSPDRACPLATEGRIEDDGLRREERVDIASASPVEGDHWRSPVRGSWSAGGDIGRHRVVIPEPNVDAGALPLRSIHSTTVVVEGRAVGVGGRSRDAASGASVARVAVGVVQVGS